MCMVHAKKKHSIPVIKIDNPVRTSGWNFDNSLFCYSDNASVVIRDSTTLDENDTVTFPQDVISLQFSDKTSLQPNQMMTFLIDGSITLWKPGDGDAAIIKNPTSNEITAVGLSYNGDCFALGTRSGDIDYSFQLYYSQSSYNLKLNGHTAAVYEINFSNDSQHFVSSALDGTFRIWNATTGVCEDVIENFEYNYYPAIFHPDGQKIISASDEYNLIIWDKDGMEVGSISMELPIFTYEISPDNDHIIVLSQNNQFHFYDIRTGHHEGFIPYFNTTPLTTHDFSADSEKLIIGHDDGSIYILNVDEVFYRPYQKPGKYKMFSVDTGEQWIYDASNQRGTQKGIDKQKKKEERLKNAAAVSWATSHNLDFRLEGKFATVSAYHFGIGAGAGYVNDYLIRPFYLGLILSPSIFFPVPDFPYKYEVGGVRLLDPYLVCYDLNLYTGHDWTINQNLTAYAELSVIGGLRQIASPALGSGNLSPGVGGSITGGVRYKDWNFYLTAGYDSLLLYNMNLGAGYRLRLRKKTVIDTDAKFRELINQLNASREAQRQEQEEQQ